jgi:hypothetical protein
MSYAHAVELKAAPFGGADDETPNRLYKARSGVEILHREVASIKNRVKWSANRPRRNPVTPRPWRAVMA